MSDLCVAITAQVSVQCGFLACIGYKVSHTHTSRSSQPTGLTRVINPDQPNILAQTFNLNPNFSTNINLNPNPSIKLWSKPGLLLRNQAVRRRRIQKIRLRSCPRPSSPPHLPPLPAPSGFAYALLPHPSLNVVLRHSPTWGRLGTHIDYAIAQKSRTEGFVVRTYTYAHIFLLPTIFSIYPRRMWCCACRRGISGNYFWQAFPSESCFTI